jgi:hypothetical protein
MSEVIDPRSTAKIPIKGFNFAAFCNFLSELFDMEIMREISIREVTVVINFSLRALDGNY